MKNIFSFFVAYVCVIFSGCSASSSNDSYCNAILSSSPVLKVPVQDVYIYGNLHHGTILIAPQCVQPVFRLSSFQDEPPTGDSGDRLRHFNQSVYNLPIKGSGVFAINGLVNVYPGENLAILVDVSEFRELDESEGQSIIRILRESRK